MPPDITIHSDTVAFAHPPSRAKTTIFIRRSERDPERVRIQFQLHLNPDITEESRAIEIFGDDLLVDYWTDISLESEQKQIVELINTLFVAEKTKHIVRRLPLTKLSDHEVQVCFGEIAERGASVFHRLFWELRELTQGVSAEQNEILREAIRSFLNRSEILCLEADLPLFPWAFLFANARYRTTDGAPDLRQFWGFRYEIQEQLLGTAKSIHLSATPSIAKAICDKLDSGNWHREESHPLNCCDHTSLITTANALGENLADFRDECFYIFAHAYQSSPLTPSTSFLMLNGESLTVDELSRIYRAPKFGLSPVVGFLNGCSTAPFREWNEKSIIGYLCLRGQNRLCCVGTTVDLPAAFGAEFAREFWRRFIGDKDPISAAILGARLAMLDKYNDPLGLMYSLYGRADTRCG
jgi:hypothetical protein